MHLMKLYTFAISKRAYAHLKMNKKTSEGEKEGF